MLPRETDIPLGFLGSSFSSHVRLLAIWFPFASEFLEPLGYLLSLDVSTNASCGLPLSRAVSLPLLLLTVHVSVPLASPCSFYVDSAQISKLRAASQIGPRPALPHAGLRLFTGVC